MGTVIRNYTIKLSPVVGKVYASIQNKEPDDMTGQEQIFVALVDLIMRLDVISTNIQNIVEIMSSFPPPLYKPPGN